MRLSSDNVNFFKIRTLILDVATSLDLSGYFYAANHSQPRRARSFIISKAEKLQGTCAVMDETVNSLFYLSAVLCTDEASDRAEVVEVCAMQHPKQ